MVSVIVMKGHSVVMELSIMEKNVSQVVIHEIDSVSHRLVVSILTIMVSVILMRPEYVETAM